MKDFKSRFCTIARRFQRFYCLSVEAKVRQLSAYTKLLVIFNISNPDNFGSEQNRNHLGQPNYTKDTVHWFIKGILVKCNRPEKK